MAGGRPRKPTAQHRLEGTFRGDRHEGRGDEAIELPRDIKRPAGLKGEAKKLWDQLNRDLGRAGVLASVDAAQLEAMCRWWGRYKELEQKATETMYDIDESDIYERRARRAWDAFDKIAGRFGMTPADRAKLKQSPKESGSDPMAEFGIVG